jgi:hypothetical protein
MDVGHGFKVAYSIEDGSVVVQDVMRKASSQKVSPKKGKPIRKATEPAKLPKAPGLNEG